MEQRTQFIPKEISNGQIENHTSKWLLYPEKVVRILIALNSKVTQSYHENIFIIRKRKLFNSKYIIKIHIIIVLDVGLSKSNHVYSRHWIDLLNLTQFLRLQYDHSRRKTNLFTSEMITLLLKQLSSASYESILCWDWEDLALYYNHYNII